ncbi:hypothetical protein NQ314_014975 [Rhamnusium bicolor]|uniref:Dimethyladenosine transferase 2, mitochondrial n=1 Tax=Rhamnusium bicolor TaxID=1586634 RepID=A0AAV8X047_9CUCU|nr:hypothetical protein NQ314_014975 [Rhamnusium bicolor]
MISSFNKEFFRRLKYYQFIRSCHKAEQLKVQTVAKPVKNTRTTHSKRINLFFSKNEDLKELKQYIPSKYFQLKRIGIPENLYLICPSVAKTIVSHLMPTLNLNSNQIICETNAGLGLIATELLENGVKLVRLYESCPDFRLELKDFGTVYPGRVELFTKDIFHLDRYAYMDKQDRANRVESLLKNVSKRSWIDGNNVKNIKCYQGVLSAGPQDNLFAYQNWTILFNLLFDYDLLDKFPRNLFLPWEPPPSKTLQRYYPANLDPDKMYLVKINFKKDIPVPMQNLLPLFYFVRQFYGKGTNRVIPTIEKWVPGCGLNIILPKLKHADYFENINIFTKFRELTPEQILSVFKEMVNYPAYSGSPCTAMIENELLKYETIETSLSDATQLEKNIVEDIEEKLDMI